MYTHKDLQILYVTCSRYVIYSI